LRLSGSTVSGAVDQLATGLVAILSHRLHPLDRIAAFRVCAVRCAVASV
jgi:hypothetical protein